MAWYEKTLLALMALLFLAIPAQAESLVGEASVAGPATLVVAGETVRLDDVRMPGEGTTCAEWRGQFQTSFDCHTHATAALTSLVAGETVACVGERSGVATCYVDGRDIAESLVQAGWAVGCGHTNRYVALEEGARGGKRGLWRGNFSLDTSCPKPDN